MQYILCLIVICVLSGCNQPVGTSSCQVAWTMEENNVSPSPNVALAIGDSMISQAVHLTNPLTIKRLKFRLILAQGAPFQVWIGYNVPSDVFSKEYVAKFDYTAPPGIDNNNTPTDVWLDLPTPVSVDPANGDIYIEVVSKSLAILTTDLGAIGPTHFRSRFQLQDHIHAWQPPDSTKGMSIGIDGTIDNCNGTQTGQP